MSATKFISFHKVGQSRKAPRVWLESRRLDALRFGPGARFNVSSRSNGVTLHSDRFGCRSVSSRKVGLMPRAIVDLNSSVVLSPLADYDTIKAVGSFGRIDLVPSVRAFHIARSRNASGTLNAVEFMAGGGTLSAALSSVEGIRVRAGLEIDPRYSDVWQAAHPEATLISADVRQINPTEIPSHEVFCAGIPCADHSNLGRSKKGLSGSKADFGSYGSLFLHVLPVISHHQPAAVILENVPAFASSAPAQLIELYLKDLGYEVNTHLIDPVGDWDEPQSRKRWVLVATLSHGFDLQTPHVTFYRPMGEYLDPEDATQDRIDAERIAKTVEGLDRHNARHKAAGHGFGYSVIDRTSRKCPTIVKNYHKINCGPFVATAYGVRMLRKHEIERICGCQVETPHYATAVEILGQGVCTRVFRSIISQVTDHLKGAPPPHRRHRRLQRAPGNWS